MFTSIKGKHRGIVFNIAFVTCISMHFVSYAEDSKVNLSVQGDLVSRFVWRGIGLNNGAAIQPYVHFSAGNYSAGLWTSYTFAQEPVQWSNLYMNYNWKFLTLTVNDYFPSIDSAGVSSRYLRWDAQSTGHIVEGMITVAGLKDIPLSLAAGIIFYGNDKDSNGDNIYSTYVELGYDFIIGENSYKAFIGGTPAKGLYSNDVNITNIGLKATKEVEITEKYSLPISGSIIVNPYMENFYLVVAFSF